LRIRIPAVKGSPATARAIERQFGCLEGIEQVQANSITGNVLFLFDSGQISHEGLLGALLAQGWIPVDRLSGETATIGAGISSASGGVLLFEFFEHVVLGLAVQGWL
jgi:hypothetical protein